MMKRVMNIMENRPKLSGILLVMALAGCTESNFAGGGGSGEDDDPPAEEAVPGDDGSDTDPPGGGVDGKDDIGGDPGPEEVDIPENCTGAGATQATLLTKTVQNGQAGNHIEYKIFLTDCEGQRKEVSANQILFDIDATSSITGNGIPFLYTLKNRGVSGELEEVRGSDLFGKVGDRYFHNRTDKEVSFTSATDFIILRVDLRGASFKPIDTPFFSGISASLPTYLRFGDAAPVRKDVTFIGSGDFAEPSGGGSGDYGGGIFGP